MPKNIESNNNFCLSCYRPKIGNVNFIESILYSIIKFIDEIDILLIPNIYYFLYKYLTSYPSQTAIDLCKIFFEKSRYFINILLEKNISIAPILQFLAISPSSNLINYQCLDFEQILNIYDFLHFNDKKWFLCVLSNFIKSCELHEIHTDNIGDLFESLINLVCDISESLGQREVEKLFLELFRIAIRSDFLTKLIKNNSDLLSFLNQNCEIESISNFLFFLRDAADSEESD